MWYYCWVDLIVFHFRTTSLLDQDPPLICMRRYLNVTRVLHCPPAPLPLHPAFPSSNQVSDALLVAPIHSLKLLFEPSVVCNSLEVSIPYSFFCFLISFKIKFCDPLFGLLDLGFYFSLLFLLIVSKNLFPRPIYIFYF